MKKTKQLLCFVLSVVMITAILGGCTAAQEAEATTVRTTTTTTTQTTVTTTENKKTTFAESSTRKVYDGLKKDRSGNYPYKLAEYSTYYNDKNETRSYNMEKAASKINNLCIPDGSVFSFNQTLGKRTVTSGYKEAHVISNGELVDGLGGGICQISSTVFEAVLRANLQIVARTNHSLKIAYVPLGGDATVDWNSKDFQFRNNTGSKILLKMECKKGKVTCKVYAKKNVKVGDVDIKIKQDGDYYVLTRKVNGKVNYTTRSFYKEAKTTTAPKADKKEKKH